MKKEYQKMPFDLVQFMNIKKKMLKRLRNGI